ncbi:hypothetical protein Adt_12946 [Abeliophyllum distichum]|uniref:Uncharacterized protein n=1 Tax=Abeliophyllum distichum TaxID=126358 RepID=A0ABD1TVD9_9LAMI
MKFPVAEIWVDTFVIEELYHQFQDKFHTDFAQESPRSISKDDKLMSGTVKNIQDKFYSQEVGKRVKLTINELLYRQYEDKIGTEESSRSISKKAASRTRVMNSEKESKKC